METLHEFMLITKANEYLLAVGFLFLFILFWRLVMPGTPVLAPGIEAAVSWMLPRGARLHLGHTWSQPRPLGAIRIGLDGFLGSLVGAAEIVTSPDIGITVKQGDPVLGLQIGSHILRIPSPITGKVTSVNHAGRPGEKAGALGGLTQDWLVRIKPDSQTGHPAYRMKRKQVESWLHTEMSRLLDFLEDQAHRPALAGMTLADGGLPVGSVLTLLDAEGLELFEQQFLAIGTEVDTDNSN
ncbi:MAG: hypothetical protein V3W14_06435 [Candidatus Neomarinimicrobiota bacterium]